MKLNNRFLFGMLSLLLAAIIAFVALPTIARQTNGKTEIVRITQPVQKGEQITASNTEVVEVGSFNLPPNTARSAMGYAALCHGNDQSNQAACRYKWDKGQGKSFCFAPEPA